MLDRAVLQQHAELVAAEARERVALAQALLQDDADLPHELVAGRVAARVVHHLELVEVEIHHRMMPAGLARARERQSQAMLELPPVDESGQRVVARLVGELRGELALAPDIVEHQHDTGDRSRAVADRRSRLVDRDLNPVAPQQHDVGGRAHGRVLAQHARDRVGDGPARRFIEHRADGRQRQAARLAQLPSGQRLGHRIQVLDAPVDVGRDHRIGDRLQRDLRALLFGDRSALRRACGPWCR